MTKEGSIYSKVVLSGEHSVLRGGAAVVAPYKKHSLNYSIEEASEFALDLDPSISQYEILFLGTLEKSLALLGERKKNIKKRVQVSSVVPLGQGLGGSAALCVFVARLMCRLGFLEESQIFDHAKNLEDIFHGESSGLDIAGCLSESLKLYYRGEAPKEIDGSLSALVFSLHSSQEVGDTKTCIERVLRMKEKDEELFYSLDRKMSQSSLKIKKAFEVGDQGLLIEGLKEGESCFKAWGLITEKMMELQRKFYDQGALAVKTTGSGLGGHLIAVWDQADFPENYQDSVFLKP